MSGFKFKEKSGASKLTFEALLDQRGAGNPPTVNVLFNPNNYAFNVIYTNVGDYLIQFTNHVFDNTRSPIYAGSTKFENAFINAELKPTELRINTYDANTNALIDDALFNSAIRISEY
jgi:hypothetical protein